MKTLIRFITLAAVTTGGFALVPHASASTPEAWNAMEKKITARCTARSGLTRAKIMPGKLGFSDTMGMEVRMVRGLDRRGRPATMACGYQRRTGLVEVQEAPTWGSR